MTDPATDEIAAVLQDVVTLCETGEFKPDIFLDFIRSGKTRSLMQYTEEPVAQTLCSPFDGLRANGIGVENIGVFPFVLSLSKHENGFVQQARRLFPKGVSG